MKTFSAKASIFSWPHGMMMFGETSHCSHAHTHPQSLGELAMDQYFWALWMYRESGSSDSSGGVQEKIEGWSIHSYQYNSLKKGTMTWDYTASPWHACLLYTQSHGKTSITIPILQMRWWVHREGRHLLKITSRQLSMSGCKYKQMFADAMIRSFDYPTWPLSSTQWPRELCLMWCPTHHHPHLDRPADFGLLPKEP